MFKDNKKAVMAILLAMVMIFSLAGCSSSSQNDSASAYDYQGGKEGEFVSFETTDLDGNPIQSNVLFSKNKVTMINVWSTTCGPCVEEMPELEKLSQEVAKKGGAVIGLVADVTLDNSLYLEDAHDIVNDTNVTFLNLKAWDGFADILPIVGTPTTYFVDSEGRLLGSPILGTDPGAYEYRMNEYLGE